MSNEWPAVWPAPAKINLFLHVVGRRPDGYHELQTIFQFIDWQDDLRFTVQDDGVITRAHDVAGIDADRDLTVRAARRLQEASGSRLGVHIHMTKRLPIGGGLGGGSSDAATTLLALNALWGLDWSLDRLAELGLSLGADVPVFVRGVSAWAEGVGERLTAVDLPEPWYVVIVPDASVLTGPVFAGLHLTGFRRPITIRDFRAGQGDNDLVAVVRARYEAVDEAWRWLEAYGRVRMSGSGASLFIEVPDPLYGQDVVVACPSRWRACVARGRNTHPVHALLRAMTHWGVAKR